MAKVIVIGDIMLDQFVYGDVTRISPEAPVPVLKTTSEILVPGGAANVCRNLMDLDTDNFLISVIGNDGQGLILQDVLTKSEIPTWVIKQDGQTTTLKSRFINNNQQLLRVDQEKAHDISLEYQTLILDYLKTHFIDSKILILSDYEKGMLPALFIRNIIKTAVNMDITVLVDSKKKNYEIFNGAFLITPNEQEYQSRDVTAMHDIQNILVTKGSKGMTLYTETNIYHISAHSPPLVDVSGAGDTVIATIASELVKGKNLYDACKTASIAASIVISKPGTATCSKEELALAIKQGIHKIMSLPELREQVAIWKAEDNTIGFINGCFNYLHAGHIHLFEKAKQQCDKLIIALNSDEYSAKVKGYVSSGRDKSVAVVPFIDAVTYFTEDTPKNILAEIQPDYHFVGSDYTKADITYNNPAKIIQIPHLDSNFSTRKTHDI